jgi:hypothetical protein
MSIYEQWSRSFELESVSGLEEIPFGVRLISALAIGRSQNTMRHFVLLALTAMLLIASGLFNSRATAAWRDRVVYQTDTAWHGDYYDAAWGTPVAIVVTPRARTQTNLGWGVGGTTVTPIRAQYTHGDSGAVEYQRPRFRPTPAWPTNTDQFGDYYIRGPR